MAKVISSSGLTVELSAREVDLVRQALRFAVDSYGPWDSYDDSEANALERVLAQGTN
ncbi:hypothetical protein AB0K92_15980 [Streptomyces sp. NPDC052687]|uniref:hypothetical protein n=1 Tax=Streptomyces sp. NPDC052687 TaxID=3154759 RepID=UPI003443A780